ncbi:MAG: type ISP restriction/modification enzyme, partial [Prevotella sp.]
DYNSLDAGAQCFPLYWYEENNQQGLFATEGVDYIRHDGISDWMLKEVRNRVGNKKITKEMIFYYVYGLLHSPDYRETFASDLKKSLPRIAIITDETEWMNFYYAGKTLAELHLNYESVEPCDVTISDTYAGDDEYEHYAVSKMHFPKKGEQGTIIYNDCLRIDDIPTRVYEYVVNGKSAVEWIMERYAVTIDKRSLIKNDPNLWSKEHEEPHYIFNLLLSVMDVSLQTTDIVERLPRLHFDGSNVTITEKGHDMLPAEEEDPNTYKGSDTLKLSIKQVSFNQIVAGTKKTEYREISNAYTANKYLATDVHGTPLCDPKHTVEGRTYHPDEYNDGHFPFVARPYKRIRLSVGSFGDSCMVEITHVTFSVARQKGNGLVVWQAEYHLGKVTNVRRKHK